jgi:hypothetical protein
VIEDKPRFISLQHILVVGGEQKYPIKHWRQDWIYEPEFIMEFVGFNGWQKRQLSEDERQGSWAQVVYQVDDSPRYAALASWQHENGISEWVSPANLRPLPRRDMTKRDDYDAILAVNRHAITPAGWVHEQDNSKLILRNGSSELLVREIGVNTYVQDDTFAFDIAEQYWLKTKSYWQAVRGIWSQLELNNSSLGLTLQGEPSELYMPLLEYAGYVSENKMPLQEAIVKAQETIRKYTTTTLVSEQNTTASVLSSR